MAENIDNKLHFKQSAMICEYEYLTNRRRENSTASLFFILFIQPIILALVIWALYNYWTKIHFIIKVIGIIYAVGCVLAIVVLVFSKELILLMFHNVISFIFDFIFAIILLPRKIFGKKKVFEPKKEDIKNTYSDITYLESELFDNIEI